MKRIGFPLLGLGLCLLGACSSVAKFTPVSRFDPADLEDPASEGTATIAGQAFLRSNDGEVKRGAGSEVLLIPDSPWTREWFEQVVREGKRPDDASYFEKLGDYARRVRADVDGKFEFRDVPAGRWFVTCLITWRRTETFQQMNWGFGLHPWNFRRGRGGRRGFRGGFRGGFYPFYPCYNQVWEREETVGGFAYAEVEVGDNESVSRLVVTRSETR